MGSNSSRDGASGRGAKPARARIGAQPDYAGPVHEDHEVKGEVPQPTNELRMTEAFIKGGRRDRRVRPKAEA